jgi:hypothetical protein
MMPQDERDLPWDSVNVVSPGASCVSNVAGDMIDSGGGLFYKDTRPPLARFVLKVDGRTLSPRSARVRSSTAEFSLYALEGEVQVVRRRVLGGV